MKRYLSFTTLLILLLSFACKKNDQSNAKDLFNSNPDVKPLHPIINEISGIADSKANPGFLWGEEDGGNKPQIYLINHDGTVLKSVYLKGATNRDWEDMALYDNTIYLSDIGDNNQAHNNYTFYIFPEPSSSIDTISSYTKVKFSYEDRAHDAEAFLVDGSTKDIYIITKRDDSSGIYKLAYPYNINPEQTAVLVKKLPYTGVVSATTSSDGKEIIIKTYTQLYYYRRDAGASIIQALGKQPTTIPYTIEPQGEAVCFGINNSGYYTLSEKGFSSTVNLYFYHRN
jgi:hypothetical protein